MNLSKIAHLIEAATLAVQVPQKQPTLREQLEAHGLSAAEQQRGQSLLEQFTQQQVQYLQRQDEQWAVAQQIKAGLSAVQTQFKSHVRVAQVAFREDKALLHALRIDRIATRRWECVQQADYFYRQLQQRKLSLHVYGISHKDVQQTRTNVAQLLQRKQDRITLKGQVEQATQDKRKTQRALQAWVTEFRMIARVAFRHQPQWLEMFGMAVATPV